MNRALQSTNANQRRELARLNVENEKLKTEVAVATSGWEFYRTQAEAGGETLKLIRQVLGGAGHTHVFNEHDACVLCMRTGARIRREAEYHARKAGLTK